MIGFEWFSPNFDPSPFLQQPIEKIEEQNAIKIVVNYY